MPRTTRPQKTIKIQVGKSSHWDGDKYYSMNPKERGRELNDVYGNRLFLGAIVSGLPGEDAADSGSGQDSPNKISPHPKKKR